MSTCSIRFLENNMAALTLAQIDYSSALTAFPISNIINPFRSKMWKPSGCFTVKTTNQYLYINDGSNKTVTLTVAKYTTPALMAAHIQTQLNAVSSNWTVSYISGQYRFRIQHTGGATLRHSVTTNAAWDLLGYTGTTDAVGTDFYADEQRNHSEEYIIFDLGYAANITAFFLIGQLDAIFPLSQSATIKLQANNLKEFDSVPYEVTLTRNDGGIFELIDQSYRYWKVSIIDRYNPLGPEGLSFGHIYLGDHITFTDRNISNGFNFEQVDPSTTQESESGALYFNERTKYSTLSNLLVKYFSKADKVTLEKMFQKLGKTTPFYISLDPEKNITTDLDEFTKYVVFSEQPKFVQNIFDKYSVQFSLREIL